jgi:hypothetical protein
LAPATSHYGTCCGVSSTYTAFICIYAPPKNSSADLIYYNGNSYLPHVGWVTIIMTEKPFIKVWSLLLVCILIGLVYSTTTKWLNKLV